jgi:hypothetical protein
MVHVAKEKSLKAALNSVDGDRSAINAVFDLRLYRSDAVMRSASDCAIW